MKLYFVEVYGEKFVSGDQHTNDWKFLVLWKPSALIGSAEKTRYIYVTRLCASQLFWHTQALRFFHKNLFFHKFENILFFKNMPKTVLLLFLNSKVCERISRQGSYLHRRNPSELVQGCCRNRHVQHCSKWPVQSSTPMQWLGRNCPVLALVPFFARMCLLFGILFCLTIPKK